MKSASDSRPNIVLILCDDLGYSDVGFNGSGDIRTPKMDRLAEAGVVFTSAYVVHPFCGPSRMGMMTGRYPHEFGAPFNLPNSGHGIDEYNRLGVPVGETLISKVLQDAGYYTGAFGKWHMGIQSEFHPNNRGFDEYYGFLGGGHRYFPDEYQPIYESQKKSGQKHINDYLLPLERNGKEVRETEYITDALSREAAQFIKSASTKDQPFFAYVAYNAPHSPLEARAEDMALYADIKDVKRRKFAGMMTAVDRGVGSIAEALKEAGEYENTLIIFLSDNGGKLALGATNAPLKGGKGDTLEGGFRVPMFFHWPKGLPGGKKFSYPVSALDFYPTLTSIGAGQIPAGKDLDGVNIIDALVSEETPRAGQPIFAMRHRNGFSDVAVRCDQWKAVRCYDGRWKLYDIDKDMSETNDLSAHYPERLQALVGLVEKWSHSHTEPKWHHELKARDQWIEADMPNFERDFQLR